MMADPVHIAEPGSRASRPALIQELTIAARTRFINTDRDADTF